MIDLAFFDFGEGDLERRDAPHFSKAVANDLLNELGCGMGNVVDAVVSEVDGERIKALRNALRTRYNVTQPKKPDTYRILQPEERQIPGATTAERDVNWVKEELPKWLPSLLDTEMRTQEDALQLMSQVNELVGRFHELRVPVLYPIWSSDPADGMEKSTLNEWLVSCGFTSTEPAYVQALDAYRADPSIDNFWTFFEAAQKYERPVNCPEGSNAVRLERQKRMAQLFAGQIMHEIIKEENGEGQLRCASGCFMSDGPFAFDYRLSGKELKKGRDQGIIADIWNVAETARKPHSKGGKSARGMTEAMGYDCITVNGLGADTRWANGNRKWDYAMNIDTEASWFALHHQFDFARHVGYFVEATRFVHAPCYGEFLNLVKKIGTGGVLKAADMEGYPWAVSNNYSPKVGIISVRDEAFTKGMPNGPAEHQDLYLQIHKNSIRASLLIVDFWLDQGNCIAPERFNKASRTLARRWPNEKLFTLKDGTQMTAEEFYYYLCAKNKVLAPSCTNSKAKKKTEAYECKDLFEDTKHRHAK